MDWKEFFKIDFGKLILFLILFIFSLLLIYFSDMVSIGAIGCIERGDVDRIGVGFPATFFSSCVSNIEGILSSDFNIIFLVIDIIFWYLISIILVYLYKKLRKK